MMKYEYGVIYDTNGEKPDLPDDVLVEVCDKKARWWGLYKIGKLSWMTPTETVKFRIVDERYKPQSNTSQTNWHERGELPPVGEKCEYTKKDSAQEVWFKGEVIGFDGGQPVIKTEKGHYYRRSARDYLFRPIRTERDVLVERAKSKFNSFDFETVDSAIDFVIKGLVGAGWRPVKQQTEDEFKNHCIDVCGYYSNDLYRAGCRFVDVGDV